MLDIRGLFNLIRQMGFNPRTRKEFWKTFAYCLLKNPKSLRYGVALIALYLHFGTFKDHVVENVSQNMIAQTKREEDGVYSPPQPPKQESLAAANLQ